MIHPIRIALAQATLMQVFAVEHDEVLEREIVRAPDGLSGDHFKSSTTTIK
jgi:hypothetical protein